MFGRTFELPEPVESSLLRVRALRSHSIRLDGEGLDGEGLDATATSAESWKRGRSWSLGRLGAGRHRLEIEVVNPSGPPLLEVELSGSGLALVSDEDWWVRVERGRERRAVVVDDTRGLPAAAGLPTPATAIADRAAPLGIVFTLTTLLAWALRSQLSGPLRAQLARRAPLVALALCALGWGLGGIPHVFSVPLSHGFDAGGHLEHVDHWLHNGAPPMPDQGWQMYQPPVYYALAAAFARLSGAAATASPAIKWVPWACGLGHVFVVWGLARRIFPTDGRRQAVAVLFAGLAPVNVYLAAYPTNEQTHGVLAGAALLGTVALLTREGRIPARAAFGVGAVFGLALLAKITSLALLPLAALILFLTRWVGSGARPLAAAGSVGWLLLGTLAVSGWWYARNAIHFGNPIVGNWDLFAWWQQPGFHTWAYYTSFGEALRQPLFSGFHSFWDALYSTFWGDAYIGGMARISDRHDATDWEWMTALAGLAVPVTAVVGFGLARGAWLAGSDPNERLRPAWFLLIAVTGAVVFMMIMMTLRLPFYAQAKAFYGLCLLGPLAVFAAEGIVRTMEWLERVRPGLEAPLVGGLASVGFAIGASFWF